MTKANVAEDKQVKRCRVGKITRIEATAQAVQVHRLHPVADGRLRVKWFPLYLSEGSMEETLTAGVPVEEKVPLQRIITEIHLLSGVMNHASARRIDASGYRIDERRTSALQAEINRLHASTAKEVSEAAYSEHAAMGREILELTVKIAATPETRGHAQGIRRKVGPSFIRRMRCAQI